MAKPAKNSLKGNKKASADELAASKLTIIDSGHKVYKAIDLKTVCGERRVGWHYGEESDVTCEWCLRGEEKGALQVPPGRFDLTDEDKDKLPVADLELFQG